MGTWGVGIFENDMASDFGNEIKTHALLTALGREGRSYDEEIIVVLDMFLRYGDSSVIDDYNKDYFSGFLEHEKKNVECWKEEFREERMSILKDLENRLNKLHVITKEEREEFYK